MNSTDGRFGQRDFESAHDAAMGTGGVTPHEAEALRTRERVHANSCSAANAVHLAEDLMAAQGCEAPWAGTSAGSSAR